MNKAIITVVGQDTVGIIARVCTYLSEKTVNVLDISQTIIDGYFNMMMIVDYSDAKDDFETIVSDLEAMSSEIGVTVIRLLTIGIPNSRSIASPVETRSFAYDVILL